MLISAHDGYPRWVDSGADFLEIDVRRSAGGAFILSHDEPAAGVRVPALDAALSVGRALQLDLKEDGLEEDLILHVLRHLAADEFVVTSGSDASINAVKASFPQVRAGLTLAEELADSTRRRIERCHADFVALDHRYEPRFKASPVPVWLWTVDDPRLLQRYVEDGWAEALITNRPELALRLRKGRS